LDKTLALQVAVSLAGRDRRFASVARTHNPASSF